MRERRNGHGSGFYLYNWHPGLRNGLQRFYLMLSFQNDGKLRKNLSLILKRIAWPDVTYD